MIILFIKNIFKAKRLKRHSVNVTKYLFLTCWGTVCEAKSQADLAIIPIEATQSKVPNQKQALRRKKSSFKGLHLLIILQFCIVN